MHYRRRVSALLLLTALLIAAGRVTADDDAMPLFERIDAAIAASHHGQLADTADDYEFLRRIYLNLLGRVPSVSEMQAFAANTEEDKRATTIDTLIASDAFTDHFAGVLDVMFMERRSGTRIANAEWQAFLHAAVRENWSFDRIVEAVLKADGRGEQRGAAKFLLDREVEPNALTRDIGRLFLGRDLQCAQCHDHPNITDYLQSEYYGIYAFVERSYLFEDASDNKTAYVGEKADGETEFKSVFLPDDDASATIPTLLHHLSLDVEPRFDGDDPYIVEPGKAAAGVPKFSRRLQLSRLITHPSNRMFARNAVNRIWKHMLGRGFVEPVDFHHDDNLPTHPALLRLLADEFVRLGFDYRELIRQIARSNAYQRSIDFPNMSQLSQRAVQAEIQQLDGEIETLQQQESVIPTSLTRQLDQRRKRLSGWDIAVAQKAKQFSKLQSQMETYQSEQKKLGQQVQAHRRQVDVMQAAATAVTKAAEVLPKDKKLGEQVAFYKQRLNENTQQLEETKQAIDKLNGVEEKTRIDLQQCREQLQRMRSARMGIADMVAEARGALQLASSMHTRHAALVRSKQQRRDSLSLYATYLAKRQLQRELTEQVAMQTEAIKAQRPQSLEVQETLNRSHANLQEQQERLDDLVLMVARQQDVLKTHHELVTALEEAEEQAGQAAGFLNDPDLANAANKLSQRREALQQAYSTSCDRVNVTREAMTAAKARLDELQADVDRLQRQSATHARNEKEREETIARRDAAIAEAEHAAEQLRLSWERRFAVRALVALTPEQLAGSTISALELTPHFARAAKAEWEKQNESKKPEDIDPDVKSKEIAALLQNRLDSVTKTYVSMFAAPGGSPQDVFSATADQALFLANDGRVQSWLSGADGTLLGRLGKVEHPQSVAQELYLAILTRPATDTEQQEVADYLVERGKNRQQALRELAWGLLSSLEFRFNR